MAQFRSKKQAVIEFKKCGKNVKYFLKTYAKIAHPSLGLIPFNTWNFQDDLLDKFVSNQLNIIGKSRQLGISTIVSGYVAWLIIFNRSRSIYITSIKIDTAKIMLNMVKTIINNLPSWFFDFFQTGDDNKTTLSLSNGSEVKVGVANDAARGQALSLLVIDEAAFIEGLEAFWTALQPTITAGGRVICLSTPNGVGDWFEKTYHAALAKENDWVPTELKWNLHPDRDEKWEYTTRRSMSKKSFAQEYEVDFQGSGDTFLEPENIVKLEESIKLPIQIMGVDKKIWIFEDCDHSIPNNHIITVDCAQGGSEEGDPWAFHVIRLSDMTQCAEGQTKFDVENVAKDIIQLGELYDNAMIVVENNSGWGVRFVEKLLELDYNNVYCSEKGSGNFVEYQYHLTRNDTALGLNTNPKTREQMLGKLEEYILTDKSRIHSSRLIKEFRSFIWKNGKPQARKGKHDDLIMSWAIGCYVREQLIGNFEESYKQMMAAMYTPKVSSTYIETSIPGMPGFNLRKRFLEEAKKQKKHQERYMWLFIG